MNHKILHIFFGLCMFCGFMFMVATAGSSDLGLIDFRTILINLVIGLGVFFLGYFGMKITDADF